MEATIHCDDDEEGGPWSVGAVANKMAIGYLNDSDDDSENEDESDGGSDSDASSHTNGQISPSSPYSSFLRPQFPQRSFQGVIPRWLAGLRGEGARLHALEHGPHDLNTAAL